MSAPPGTNPDPDRLPRSRPRGETVRRLARLALKELRETLRDRRTIITLVLMPLLLYPLLGLALQKFLVTSLRPPAQPVYVIAVRSKTAEQIVLDALAAGEVFLERQQAERLTKAEVEDRDESGTPAEQRSADESHAESSPTRPESEVAFRIVADPSQAVEQYEADVAVHVAADPAALSRDVFSRSARFEIVHLENSATGRRAVDFIEQRFEAVNEEFRKRRLEQFGISRRETPIQSSRTSLGDSETGTPFSFAALVPLILILMTITGAVYPAIDLTAGERERGTLELLVAAPVPRLALLLAKYAAVLVVALLTATVNLVAMTVTVLGIGLGGLLFGEAGLSIVIVVQVFALLILFAAFFSAVLLALTSMARSFKEAQAYLIPLMLVSLAPGILSMVPGVTLTGVLAVVPLANIVLLARDLFERTTDPGTAMVVVLSTLLYAMAAITMAARIFGADAILYGSRGSWTELFRRARIPASEPTVASAMLCLALAFPASFLVMSGVARLQHAPVAGKLALTSLATAAIFVGLPTAAAAMRRVRFIEGFRLRPASPIVFAGAVVLGVSLWPFAYESVLWMHELRLAPWNPTVLEMAERLSAELRSLPVVLVLLTLAVVPAVAEEFFFRGYLFSAFRARMAPAGTIVLSAVLFGVFHVVVRDALAIERLLPSTLLGLVLGWVCYRTGSIFPGIVLHACHNGFLLMGVYYKDELTAQGWGIEERSHLPVLWLLLAAALAVGGAGLIRAGKHRAGERSEDRAASQPS